MKRRSSIFNISDKAKEAARKKLKECQEAEAKNLNPSRTSNDGSTSPIPTNVGVPQTVSFSSASGRKIVVSEEAVEAAKAKLTVDDLEKVPEPGSFVSGFSTASGSKVVISNEALEAAKAKLIEDDLEKVPQPGNSMSGFSTASGKKVLISNEALEVAKAKLIHDDLDINAPPSKIVSGFSTAGGRKVSISNQALHAAKAKLVEDDLKDVPQTITFVSGFATAGGKKIVVSNEAVEAAKVKLIDADLDLVAAPPKIISGFSTAGGRKVSISNEALEAAKSKLVDDDLEQAPETVSFVSGFTTAAGKQVVVSDEALEAAMGKLVDDDLEKGHQPRDSMFGFSTASGKKVKIADEAVKAAKAKIEDEDWFSVSPETVDKLENLVKEMEGDAEEENSMVFEQQNEIHLVMTDSESKMLHEEGGDSQEKKSEEIGDATSEIDESFRILLEDIENSDDEQEWSITEDPELEKKLRYTLAFVQSGGEVIPSLKVAVVRIYPIMFCALGKDGRSSFMTEKAFAKLQQEKSQQQAALRERFLPEIEADIRSRFILKEKINTKDLTPVSLAEMDAEELLHILNNLEDDAQTVNFVMGHINLSTKKDLEHAKSQLLEKIRQAVAEELEEKMKSVVPTPEKPPSRVLKIRVMDVATLKTGEACSPTGILTIWNPQEEIVQSIGEGKLYEFQALKPGSFHPGQEIRLGTTKTTRISPVDEVLEENAFERKLCNIEEVVGEGFSPPFGEFDVVGVVQQVEGFKEKVGQIVSLVEEDGYILKIKFWNSLKDSDLQDVFKIGKIVACLNLQWRFTSVENKTAFAYESSVFLSASKDEYLLGGFQRLVAEMEEIRQYLGTEEEPSVALAVKPPAYKPFRVAENKAESEATVTPQTSAKLRYLECYEEPPELPVLAVTSPSKQRRVSKKFVTPRRVSPKK